MNSDDETFVLLLLSDSNLPTGSFVASSGLESYIKHGFGSQDPNRTFTFMRDSIASYARSALPFVSDAHRLIEEYRDEKDETGDGGAERILTTLRELDQLYETMTLNHVTRRASKAQGVALLTLYSKGFTSPSSSISSAQTPDDGLERNESKMAALLAAYKLSVRREAAHGHLPICWGILTATLGLALDRSQFLHVFLHARSLLSASMRLNEIGPYNSQQILLHLSRPIIEEAVAKCRDLRTGIFSGQDDGFDETIHGPANTWPLGELLAARHDLQHSRIFNS